MGQSEWVFDAQTADFDTTVIARSREVPVLVDFWASWCGPCRVLGPVVEAEVARRGGEVVLAKVDTEASPELAQRYQIRSIPCCKLFVDGAVAAEFVGALPAAKVREFLDTKVPREIDRLVAQAAATEGDASVAILERAIALDPTHATARLALARAALTRGDSEAALRHVDAIPGSAAEADQAAHVRAAAGFVETCQRAGGLAASRARSEQDPNDLDALLDLGGCLAATAKYQEALDVYLMAVERNKRYRDEAARKAMLTIFGVIGTRSALANEYRRKLAIVL